MTTKHTREPWEVDTDASGSLCIAGRSGWLALIREAGNNDYPEAEANARRIVAAVNGCAGIPTEALEAGVVADMLEALQRVAAKQGTNIMGEALCPLHGPDCARGTRYPCAFYGVIARATHPDGR